MNTMNTIRSLVDSLDTLIANCKKALSEKVLTDTNYIVGRDNLFIASVTLDENGMTTGEHTLTSDPTQAMKFSLASATAVAKITRNGNGFFTAIGYADACQHTLDDALKSRDNASQYLLAA